MKKYFLILFLLSPFFAFPQEDEKYEKWLYNVYLKHYKEPISNSEWNNRIQNIPKKYKLKYKDNLWDLSGSFLKDSLYWSKLWVTNPKVENPHLIYKDNFIQFDPFALSQVNKSKFSVDIQDQFPGLEAPPIFSKRALTEGQIPSSLPDIPLFIPVNEGIDFRQLIRAAPKESQPIPFYLSDSTPDPAGEILGRDNYGRLFGVSGDKVILRLGNNVPIGSYFTVFKNKGRFGEFLRLNRSNEYEIQVKGVLKVVSYIQGTGSLYKARVVSALDQMSAEDSILRGRPAVYSFSDKKIARGEGEIIGSPFKSRAFLTIGSIVFLNRGAKDGLYKTAVFYIRPNTEKSNLFKRPYNYEGAVLGKLKVIHVSKNKATAVILSAKDKIYVGDAFSGIVSSTDMEKIEEGDIVDKGQELLLDFEEMDSREALKESLKPDQGLKETKESIDFEKIEQEEMLEDPNTEEDDSLKQDFDSLGGDQFGADFEMEEEPSAKEENVKDYEKDENIEDHFELDALEWSEDLSEGKKEIKNLNKDITESKEELEDLDETLSEKELEFEELEAEVLEQEVEQKLEENEDLNFEIEEPEIEEGLDQIEEEDWNQMEEVESIEAEEDENLEDTEKKEKELEEPKSELEEFEEIDLL